MLDIFNSVNRHHFSSVKFSKWDYVKRSFVKERIDIIRSYYRNTTFPISQTHFLVRMLTSLGLTTHEDPEDIYDRVDASINSIVAPFKCTNEDHLGKFYKGEFYGPSTIEHYFFYDDCENIFDAISNWKDYASVKVLYNEKSDLMTLLPKKVNGQGYSKEGDLAIFQINLPVMAAQYSLFRKEALKNPNGDASIETFLGKYVIPNILPSQLDWCILNRLIDMKELERVNHTQHPEFKYPFTLPRYDNETDFVLEKVLEHIDNTVLDFREILFNIPAIYNDTMLEMLTLPTINHTLQASWLMILARLRIVRFMMKLRHSLDNPNNQGYLNQLMLEIRISQFEKTFLPKLPDVIRDDLSPFIELLHKKTN